LRFGPSRGLGRCALGGLARCLGRETVLSVLLDLRRHTTQSCQFGVEGVLLALQGSDPAPGLFDLGLSGRSGLTGGARRGFLLGARSIDPTLCL
jgi:hypothetical protein